MTLLSALVVGHNLAAAGAAVATPAGLTTGSAPPASVTLTITERSAHNDPSYVYSVSGQRRTQ